MICTLTAGRLKPGAYDAFREAWDPGDAPAEVIGRWKQVYHARDVTDPDVVISFGMFDGSLDELREIQQQPGAADPGTRRPQCRPRTAPPPPRARPAPPG